MNKKGFTLTELLAVVVIIALLSTLAVPNIISMLNRSKNEKFVTDAKQVIAKAKYYHKKNRPNSYPVTVYVKDLDVKLEKSPFDNDYDINNSIVKVTKDTEGTLTYSIYLVDKKDGNNIYCIGTFDNPKSEAELKDSVKKCS